MNTLNFEPPIALFLGDVADYSHAKTAAGLLQWRPDDCAGQARHPGCPVDLGLPDLDAEQAKAAGIRSVVVGVASAGGQIPDSWIDSLASFARAGINVVSGMHSKLGDFPLLAESAREGGGKLIDVRVPPPGIPVATGIKRGGKRVLMVGTDCAVGKKFTALALAQELKDQGANATFRATGQTGIMIAGSGIPLDSVVADFLPGAAELISPANDPDHWDVIEGQGSMHHAAYAAVTTGLIHGSQPDALVVCHEYGRDMIIDMEEGGYRVPSIADAIDANLRVAQLTNPSVRCVGISVNTSQLDDAERRDYLAALSDKHGLPAIDPIATGTRDIAEALMRMT